MKQLTTKTRHKLSLFLFLIFCNSYAQLALVSNQNIDFSSAVSTISSGNWSNPQIWSSGVVPNATTDVIIDDNHLVYIDVEGSVSGEIVDLCRNLQVKQTAILQMGHNTPNFSKDLRINGSILCNGTFSSGRNQPNGSGDGLIYTYNSRIYLNLIDNDTYISGSGFFNPRSLSIASNFQNTNLTIDLYNITTDDNFAIKSDNRVNVIISHFAYLNIKGTLGLTGSDYQFSSPTAKSDLTIHGIVVADDVSLFTKNTTVGESSSLTIENEGSLYSQKINKGILNRKSEAAGFTLSINSGGLFRLGQNVNFNNLMNLNPNFFLNNNGELRVHYSNTMSSTSEITAAIDANDPNQGVDVSQIQDIFGATHIAGWYNFTDRPYLLEGLDKYRDFGATSLKTTLTTVNGNMYNAYHFNHSWPVFQTLKEVAQHEYIDSLFQRQHIKTHTFWTTTKRQSDFKEGPDFNHDNYLFEEQMFYDLTKHLLDTYGDIDKTFVYQNWEGDWMLRGQGVSWENNTSLIPDDVEWLTEGMARLFRARQRGTERARNENTTAIAKVYLGLEFNKLWFNSNGNYTTMMDSDTPCVIADVAPRARLDLISWSAYDGGWTNNNNPYGHAMWKGIEMAKYFITETGAITDKIPVQIGEFGLNENPPYNGENTEAIIRTKYGRYIGLALGLNIQNFYLWNTYGNDRQGPAGFTWEKNTQYETPFLYQYLVGKWLVEPDGNWGYAATFLMEQWANTLSNTEFNLANDNILIYPNPSSGSFKINGLLDNESVTIMDIHGKILRKFKNVPDEKEINLNFLNKGLYLILIENDDKQQLTKKLIIN